MSSCMLLLQLLLLVASVSGAPNPTANAYEALWKQFVSEHNKKYGPRQISERFQIFQENVDFITDHNKNHAHRLGYKVAINQFADMTSAEFKSTMTGYNSPARSNLHSIEILPHATADSVDWTHKNAVTPVKNQGTCLGCWAFSAVGAVEGINAITTGKLRSFSEQQLISCSNSYGNNGCNGGSVDNGFKYIEAKGDVLETTYPYTSQKSDSGSCIAAKTKDPVVSISGHKDVLANSESQLRAAVQQQPVSAAIEADQSGFQFYKSGVFTGPCGHSVDHGVLVVGYGTASSTSDGSLGRLGGASGYWKVKNSWGTTWGEHGYIRMARDNSTTGLCGLYQHPSYPTMGTPPPSPPAPPTPPPSPNGYIAIDEKSCPDDKCGACKDGGLYRTNKCLETTLQGLYIIGNCTSDGSKVTEYTFSDSKCTVLTGSYPEITRSCNPVASGGYRVTTCETSMVRNYSSIAKADCAQDNYCWTCSPAVRLQTNACLADEEGDGHIIANCSEDGASVTQYEYSDANCGTFKSSVTFKSGECSSENYRYGIWSCEAQ